MEYRFSLKSTTIENATFLAKLPCQKAMLRQIEWGVQNGPMTRNGVLPLTTLFFSKFDFSIRISYK